MNIVYQKAIFAAGCFWGVESIYSQIDGVISTEVGYTGGDQKDPTYESVCTGRSGHAEAVQIEYDPEKVSYDKLLNVFWMNHNPTTLNQQGPDIGSQYRSAIFYFTQEQKVEAENSKKALDKSGKWKNPVVTEIKEAEVFFAAEAYHQKYFAKRGITETCYL